MPTAAEMIAKYLQENPSDPDDGSYDMFLQQKIAGLAERITSGDPTQQRHGEKELVIFRNYWAEGDGTSGAIITGLIALGIIP